MKLVHVPLSVFEAIDAQRLAQLGSGHRRELDDLLVEGQLIDLALEILTFPDVIPKQLLIKAVTLLIAEIERQDRCVAQ